MAGVAEAFRQRISIIMQTALPEGLGRLDYEHALTLNRVARFVLRDEDLMQLLTGANSDDGDLRLRRDGPGEVNDTHAGDLRDKDFAAVHLFEALDDEAHALLSGQPEAGHAVVGDGD